MDKIWAYFDQGERHYGTEWPIRCRTSTQQRLDTLAVLGVRDVPALTYAHRPGMAAGLNAWCRGFADEHPRLGAAWDLLADARVPVVIHAGNGPRRGASPGWRGGAAARRPP